MSSKQLFTVGSTAAVFLLMASGAAKAGGPEFYYLDGGGFPWGSGDYTTTMDMNFGAGGWANDDYGTVNVGQLLSGDTSFIYMEGGDSSASELNTFLGANLAGLQTWVAAGGTLLLNAAPNEGGNINFGFGGVLLTYPDFDGSDTAHAVDGSHPIFNGPFGVVATDYTGTSFSHSTVAGGGISSIMDNGAGNSVLAELIWGSGGVVFGGMTAPQFHDPDPDSINLHANIIAYTTTIPAPGALALLGLGWIAVRRRRRSD